MPKPPKPVIFSVVGFQDAGKTLLVEALTRHATEEGYRVAVIKHDGHADEQDVPDWEKPTSDTVRAARSGAQWTMVASRRGWLIHAWDSPSDQVDDWIDTLLATTLATERRTSSSINRNCPNGDCSAGQAEAHGPDVIVVEGAKHSQLPKIAAVKDDTDIEALQTAGISSIAAWYWTGPPRLDHDLQPISFDRSKTHDLWGYVKNLTGL